MLGGIASRGLEQAVEGFITALVAGGDAELPTQANALVAALHHLRAFLVAGWPVARLMTQHSALQVVRTLPPTSLSALRVLSSTGVRDCSVHAVQHCGSGTFFLHMVVPQTNTLHVDFLSAKVFLADVVGTGFMHTSGLAIETFPLAEVATSQRASTNDITRLVFNWSRTSQDVCMATWIGFWHGKFTICAALF